MQGEKSIERVAVIGGGTMGSGIAQVIAQSGLTVTLVDIDEGALSRASERIGKSLERLVRREKISAADAEATLARLATSTDLEQAASAAQHVVETVIEDFEAKRDVLRRLDAVCGEDVIFASNTSQFSITKLAATTGRPDRVIGSHWFNPPPVMKLIEVIRGVETSDATLATMLELAARFGKETIVCEKDTPGFITSRLIVGLALEAARIVEEGIASPADVNRACVLAFNHAMGPLDTVDFSGLDTTIRVADNMRDQYGERFLAPQSLRSLVNGGHLGRKTGRGFSDYGNE
jgi:3-hydroxybutyryl-CoA dehydrogenase